MYRIPGPKQKTTIWVILKFVFILCKAVKVSQNDQIQM